MYYGQNLYNIHTLYNGQLFWSWLIPLCKLYEYLSVYIMAIREYAHNVAVPKVTVI